MARIRVNPEQVRAVARQFRRESEACQAILNRIHSQVNGIQWEGMSKIRFMEEYERWREQMRQYINSLNGIAAQLDRIAIQFAQADHQQLS